MDKSFPQDRLHGTSEKIKSRIIMKARPLHKTTKKTYNVTIDMNWSKGFTVRATGSKEAKQKVWNRIRRRLAIPAIFNVTTEIVKK